MKLSEDFLLKKEDVYDIDSIGGDEYIDDVRESRVNIYRRGVLPFISEFKKLIEKGDGEIIVKIRDIRNMLGWEKFGKRDDNVIYYRLRTILLEYGIKVKLYHHYGANLVMELVSDESEIISEVEITRMRQDKVAKKSGFSNWGEYTKNQPYYRKIRPMSMYDKDCKKYFIHIGKRFIIELFPGAIANERVGGNQYTEYGKYDWVTSNGLKVKHVASTLRRRTDKEGFEREYFQWGIFNTNIADIFVLTGWGDSTNLDLMKAWIISKGEIVNGREFWDRKSFVISTHDRSIDKYCKYEIDDSILEEIRENIEKENNLIVVSEDYTVIIRKWYSDIFRTITWIDDNGNYDYIDNDDEITIGI
jgi:hypothetical protein